MDDRLRWVGIALAVLALAGMVTHYPQVADDHTPYTQDAELAEDYDAHLGDETYFWAEVTAVESDRIRVDNYAIDVWVYTDDPPPGLSPGDIVQVAGTVRSDHRIDASRVVASPRANRRYMFAVSGLAALLVAGLTLRHWRVDLRTLTVRPRRGRTDGEDPAVRTAREGEP
jgi:hypothetical protein